MKKKVTLEFEIDTDTDHKDKYYLDKLKNKLNWITDFVVYAGTMKITTENIGWVLDKNGCISCPYCKIRYDTCIANIVNTFKHCPNCGKQIF